MAPLQCTEIPIYFFFLYLLFWDGDLKMGYAKLLHHWCEMVALHLIRRPATSHPVNGAILFYSIAVFVFSNGEEGAKKQGLERKVRL